jgi:hypothetical protein
MHAPGVAIETNNLGFSAPPRIEYSLLLKSVFEIHTFETYNVTTATLKLIAFR